MRNSNRDAKMKRVLITLLLVISAVLFAGCTSQNEPPASEQVTQTNNPVSTPDESTAATPTISTISTAQSSPTIKPVAIFTAEFHQVDYQWTHSSSLTSGTRSSSVSTIHMERSQDTYKNTPALREKYTIVSDYPEYVNNVSTMVKGGWVGTQNLYYDASTGSYFGGTWSESVQGIVKKQEEYNGTAYAQRRPEDHPAGSLGIAPFGEMNISFTDEGVESVTVPYGSYPDARNYSGTYKNGMPIAFWVASGVPVPVKYQYSDGEDSDGKDPLDVFELTGWG